MLERGAFREADFAFEEGGFHAAGALEAVEGIGDLGDEQGFPGALGAVPGEEFGAEFFVLGTVLNGDDDMAGGPAVPETVA